MKRGIGMKRRIGVALVVATLLGGAACGDDKGSAGSDPSPSTSSAAPTGQVEYVSTSIPDTEVGQQLRWLLDATRTLPIPVPDIEAHFAPEFLAQLPADELNAFLASGGVDTSAMQFLGVLTMTPTSIEAVVDPGAGGPHFVVALVVDGKGRIATFVVKAVPLESRAILGLAPVSMPEPTGPSEVGTETVVATDPSRDGRRVPVQLWYPAVGGNGAAPYAQAETTAFLAQAMSVPLEDVAAIDTNATAAPGPIRSGRLPVVVFSPGFGVTRPFYSGLSAELASHGYLVAVVDHPGDGLLVEFPDGPSVPAPPSEDEDGLQEMLAPRVAAVRTVLDLLERLDAEPGGPLHQTLDLSRVALAGHSLGGATAGEAMRLDRRFKVGVNLDGTMYGDVVGTGLDRPFLLVSSARPEEPEEDATWVTFRSQTLTAQSVAIAGSGHMTFTDWPALASFRPGEPHTSIGVDIGTIEPGRSFEVQSAYVLAFLDRHLLGRTAPLLDGPSPEYPELQFR